MRFCPYIYARTLQGPRIWDDRKQYLKTKTWDLGRRTQNQRLGTPGAQNPQFWEPRSRTLGSGTSRPMNQILEPRAQNHRVQDPGLSVYKIFKTFNFIFSFFLIVRWQKNFFPCGIRYVFSYSVLLFLRNMHFC